MKKTDFSNIALKMEASPRFNLHNQEGMAERFAAIIDALGNNYGGFMRISGATVGISGSTYTAAPGKVYYNGEIYTVDGNAVNVPGGQTAVWQIQTEYTRNAWHGDGTQKPTFYENKMVLVAGASGSGVANYNGGSTLQAQLLLYIGQDAAINNAINALIAAAPGALNTLNELAAALGDDPNFATTVTNSLATKLNLSGGSMTGAIAMGGNKITGLGAATANGDAMRYQEAVRTNGGNAFTGNQSMGGNKLTSVGSGTAAADAVNKGQLDAKLDAAKWDLGAGTPNLRIKKIDIGNWNMDSTALVSVPHGIAGGVVKIRQISAVIYGDETGTDLSYDLNRSGYCGCNNTNILLGRTDAGYFDDTSYDFTPLNRGVITIIYEA